MRGKYWLKVSNNRVSYSLKLNRCISIIKGDSGTGKTYLLHLLKDYIKNGKKSGVYLSSNIQNIDVLDDERRWKDTLLKNRNYIYFADEDAKFVLTKEFSDLLKLSGSYLVYVTRSGKTGFLQYSISDVYRFESRNVNNKYLTEMFNLYEDRKTCFKPDLILTEDSTSGLDIFKHIVSVDVKSSFGKDNMVNKLREYSNFYTNIYVFVDGAAFGNQIEYLLTLIDSLLGCNICVFAPESFEYLLLNTSRFRDLCYNELLNTSDYVESSIYRTYENYFEDLLSNICNDNFSHVKYEKVSWNKLNLFFKQNSLLEEVFNQLIDIDDSVKCIDGIKAN